MPTTSTSASTREGNQSPNIQHLQHPPQRLQHPARNLLYNVEHRFCTGLCLLWHSSSPWNPFRSDSPPCLRGGAGGGAGEGAGGEAPAGNRGRVLHLPVTLFLPRCDGGGGDPQSPEGVCPPERSPNRLPCLTRPYPIAASHPPLTPGRLTRICGCPSLACARLPGMGLRRPSALRARSGCPSLSGLRRGGRRVGIEVRQASPRCDIIGWLNRLPAATSLGCRGAPLCAPIRPVSGSRLEAGSGREPPTGIRLSAAHPVWRYGLGAALPTDTGP